MTQIDTFATASAIASCTLDAAHRRDHTHDDAAPAACHPHNVEVVHLGGQAAMVCHDCHTDSGFIAYRDAWHLACDHRLATTTSPGPASAA
jgi:hypothetical protein